MDKSGFPHQSLSVSWTSAEGERLNHNFISLFLPCMIESMPRPARPNVNLIKSEPHKIVFDNTEHKESILSLGLIDQRQKPSPIYLGFNKGRSTLPLQDIVPSRWKTICNRRLFPFGRLGSSKYLALTHDHWPRFASRQPWSFFTI